MAGRIDELQRLASEPGVSVADLLRKTKLVAVKLRQSETAAWAETQNSAAISVLPASFRSIEQCR